MTILPGLVVSAGASERAMTVTRVCPCGLQARCCWFDSDGHLHDDWFDIGTLHPADRESPRAWRDREHVSRCEATA